MPSCKSPSCLEAFKFSSDVKPAEVQTSGGSTHKCHPGARDASDEMPICNVSGNELVLLSAE